jgi:hypothetical protein
MIEQSPNPTRRATLEFAWQNWRQMCWLARLSNPGMQSEGAALDKVSHQQNLLVHDVKAK